MQKHGLKLVKAKTCNGCKASYWESNPLRYTCVLMDFDCTSDGAPKQECPKPKTNEDFFNFNEIIRISLTS